MAYNLFGADFAPLAIAYGLSFIALLAGSITDLKTREVPDWLNYGLMISGIGLNLLFSVIYFGKSIAIKDITFNDQLVHQYILSSQSYLLKSIICLVIFFGIAYIMFYAGQWGGGDSKILMGLGAMIGIDVGNIGQQFLLGFFINALFVGAIYGLLWSIFLVFKNKKKFGKEFKRIASMENAVKAKKFMLAALFFLLVFLFFIDLIYIKILALSFAFLILTAFYLWIFVKAVEKSCMYKLVEPSKLTEGDWIVKDVYVGGKYITGPKDLGIEKKQIRKLIELYQKGKVRKILIKGGIPFVPSFFIAFVVTFAYGNLILTFI